jgi:flagellar biosynthesis/type III secretory pathway chaperone
MTMDEATRARLIELMKRMYGAHQELLEALRRQQQAVRCFDVAELEQLREHCDRVAQRIAELETTRRELLGPGVRLRELLEQIAEPDRSKLAALSAGLRKLAGEIDTVNRINRTAVETMIRHVHTLYQAMAKAASQSAYGQDGKSAAGKTTSLMIDQVA